MNIPTSDAWATIRAAVSPTTPEIRKAGVAALLLDPRFSMISEAEADFTVARVFNAMIRAASELEPSSGENISAAARSQNPIVLEGSPADRPAEMLEIHPADELK